MSCEAAGLAHLKCHVKLQAWLTLKCHVKLQAWLTLNVMESYRPVPTFSVMGHGRLPTEGHIASLCAPRYLPR